MKLYSGKGISILAIILSIFCTTALFSNNINNNTINTVLNGEGEEEYERGIAAYNSSEYLKAINLFQEAAELGHIESINMLDKIHEAALGEPTSLDDKVALYETSALAGSEIAMMKVAKLYEKEVNNAQRATKYYTMAANKYNNVDAMFNLGVIAESPYTGMVKYAEAMKWYKKAAEFGHYQSMNNVGNFYLKGQGVEQDYEIARQWYEEAIKGNNDYAYTHLGEIYENGWGVEVDLEKAAEFYETAVEFNAYKGQENLERVRQKLYQTTGVVDNTNDVPSDSKVEEARREDIIDKAIALYGEGKIDEAIALLKSEIENNDNPEAIFYLARVYYLQKFDHISMDEIKSLYKEAADKGHGYAYIDLYEVYAEEKDYDTAHIYLDKAIEFDIPNAYHQKGLAYEFARGVDRDYHKALEYLHTAYDKGNTNSAYEIAYIYMFKVENEGASGFKWAQITESHGDIWGKILLADAYQFGIGVQQSYRTASDYYIAGYESEIPYATYMLGLKLLTGNGTNLDRATGVQFLKKAADDDLSKAMYVYGVSHCLNLFGVGYNYALCEDYLNDAALDIEEAWYALEDMYDYGIDPDLDDLKYFIRYELDDDTIDITKNNSALNDQILNSFSAADSSSGRVTYLYGFKNEAGEVVIPPTYDNVKGFTADNLAAVKINGLWGYINKQNEMVIKPQFAEASWFRSGYAVVGNGRNDGVINIKGERVVPIKYSMLSSYSEGFFTGFYGGAWGFVDTEGNHAIPFTYRLTHSFSEGLAGVSSKETEKWGFIDKQNNLVIGYKYDYVEEFQNGFARVTVDNKKGFINKNGVEVIAPVNAHSAQLDKEKNTWLIGNADNLNIYTLKNGTATKEYESLTVMEGSVYSAQKGGKYALLTKYGEPLTELIYDKLNLLHGNYYRAELNGKQGAINDEGNTVIPFVYDNIYTYQFDIMIAKKNGKYGIIDIDQNIIADFKYDMIYNFKTPITSYKLGSKEGYINTKGEELTGAIYDKTYSFDDFGCSIFEQNNKQGQFCTEGGDITNGGKYDEAFTFLETGYARVMNNGKYGFINSAGEELTEIKYEKLYAPAEGVVIYEENGLYGYIKLGGKEMTAARFTTARAFNGKFATVEENAKWGSIDSNGDTLIPIKYDKIYAFSHGFAIYDMGGTYGYLSEDGTEITEAIFSGGRGFLEEGFAAAQINGKWGLINTKGETIAPFEYDSIDEEFTNGIITAYKRSVSDKYNVNGQKVR